MKTRISDRNDHTLVEVSGYIDFENTKPITESLDEIYKKNENAQVLLDLSGLEFVGSSGISGFVKGLRIFNRMRMKPCYFGVKNEFLRLFRAFEDELPFEIHENKQRAHESAQNRFRQWEERTLRSKQTH